jgi:hypothetical protein
MYNFRTYKETDAAGVAAHRAVVRGTNDGECKKPAAANAGGFVGITAEAQATQNKGVSVQIDGIALAEMYGTGSYGDAVNIGDTSGRLASCQTELVDTAEAGGAYLTYVVGYAEKAWTQTGDLIPIRICPQVKLTPVT